MPPSATGHSSDGRWWWDGNAWLPAWSPDGRNWFDGTHWVPLYARGRGESLGGPRGTRLLLGFGLVLLTVGLISFAGYQWAHPHPRLSELKQIPGAELTYPGSVHEVNAAADSNHKFGVNPAFFGQRGFTHDSPSAVFAFFEQALAHDGWVRTDSIGRGSEAWSDYRDYRRGARVFELGIVSSEEHARLKSMDPRYATYPTVYETLIG
jgi:hypothetical protein